MSDQQIPAWLRSSNPPAHSARSEDKIKWVRRQIRGFARFTALEQIYQLGPDETEAPFLHVLEAAVGFAGYVGVSFDGAHGAFQAEWGEAKEQARHYADALRKAVWTLGRDRAPGPEILARAIAVNIAQHERFGIDLSSDDLLKITRTIVVSAATGRAPGGR
jgi:hypothetical protein